MNSLPHTSETHYITGKAALNVPNDDGSFADWHFDEVFLSGRGKIRVAGADAPETTGLLGSYGIRECSGVLMRFGVAVEEGEKVYVANYIRALLDMALSAIAKRRVPDHVSVQDMLDSPQDVKELHVQVQNLKEKMTDQVALSLLSQWEQKQI